MAACHSVALLVDQLLLMCTALPAGPLTSPSSLCSAMSSDKNKELFLRQVEQILDGIKQEREMVRLATEHHEASHG